MPFHSDSAAKIYIFFEIHIEKWKRKAIERITILFLSQSVFAHENFSMQEQIETFSPFFFFFISWYRGTYFIEISPQFVRFVSTVIQAQGDDERMVNDICTRVHMRGQHFCALNKNDSQYLGQWLIFLRRFWDGIRERSRETREKEREGRRRGWRRRRRRNKSVPLFVAP